MILELDCGNTRIKWRMGDGDTIVARGAFASASWIDEIGQVIRQNGASINRAIVSSVLGDSFRRQFSLWAIDQLGVSAEFAVSEPHAYGVINGYQEPEKLGVDRWLAIVAARQRAEGACIVIDCGSAVTLDVITAEGEHIGGYIAPGLQLMRHSLGMGTTQIKLGLIGYPDSTFPGRNTIAAIKSAELAMLNGLISAARASLVPYGQENASLIFTGGDGQWLADQNGSIYTEDLVFEGLEIVMGHAITKGNS